MALNERGAAELLQAGAGGGKSLTGALCTRTGVLWGEKEELELDRRSHYFFLVFLIYEPLLKGEKRQKMGVLVTFAVLV